MKSKNFFLTSVIIAGIIAISNSAYAVTWNDYGDAYTTNIDGKTVRAPQYDRDTGNSRYDNVPRKENSNPSNSYSNAMRSYNPNIPGMIKPIQPQFQIKRGTY